MQHLDVTRGDSGGRVGRRVLTPRESLLQTENHQLCSLCYRQEEGLAHSISVAGTCWEAQGRREPGRAIPRGSCWSTDAPA